MPEGVKASQKSFEVQFLSAMGMAYAAERATGNAGLTATRNADIATAICVNKNVSSVYVTEARKATFDVIRAATDATCEAVSDAVSDATEGVRAWAGFL